MVWVICPAGQVQVPAIRSMTKSSLGKCFRLGRPGTRATSLRPPVRPTESTGYGTESML